MAPALKRTGLLLLLAVSLLTLPVESLDNYCMIWRLNHLPQQSSPIEIEIEEKSFMAIDKSQLRELIRETLIEVGLHSQGAEELLMLTAAAESNLGEYIEQTKGPAVGIFQMEPATFKDIMGRWLDTRDQAFRDKINLALSRWTGDDYSSAAHGAKTMRYNMKVAIVVARLLYLSRPGAIPQHTDHQGLVAYWKKNWNTELGKGTVAGAMKKYSRYVLES